MTTEFEPNVSPNLHFLQPFPGLSIYALRSLCTSRFDSLVVYSTIKESCSLGLTLASHAGVFRGARICG